MDPHGRVFEVDGVPPDVSTRAPAPTAPDALRFRRDIDIGTTELDRLLHDAAARAFAASRH
jgi:carboxyl-terminal processing protease